MSLSNSPLDDVTNRFCSLHISDIHVPNPEVCFPDQSAKLSQLPEDVIGEIFTRSFPQEHVKLEQTSKKMLSIGKSCCSISTACKRVPLHQNVYSSLNLHLQNEPEVVIAYLSTYSATRYQDLPDAIEQNPFILRETLLHYPRLYFSLSEACQKRFDYFFCAQIGCQARMLEPLNIKILTSPRGLSYSTHLEKTMNGRKEEIKQLYLSKVSQEAQIAFDNIWPNIQSFLADDVAKLIAITKRDSICEMNSVSLFLSKLELNSATLFKCCIKDVFREIVQSPALILRKISKCPEYITVNSELVHDKSFALRAVQVNGLVLEYLPASFKKSRMIVAEAIYQNPNALAFASLELQQDQQLKALVDERKALMPQAKNVNIRFI